MMWFYKKPEDRQSLHYCKRVFQEQEEQGQKAGAEGRSRSRCRRQVQDQKAGAENRSRYQEQKAGVDDRCRRQMQDQKAGAENRCRRQEQMNWTGAGAGAGAEGSCR